MTQQTSPFIEGKFGWALGESNWNLGMDENLLKFSYLFDRNIDGIVSSLPVAVNSTAYFNTSDNRVYYVVSGTYYSSPVPKWFEFTLRTTGELYQFNGTTLILLQNNSQLDIRVTSVENTKVAKVDLANSTDITKGSALVGYKDRTQYAKNGDVVSVDDFSASPNALVAALAFLAPTGGRLLVNGNYAATSLVVPNGVQVYGAGSITLTGTAGDLITLNSNSTITGLSITHAADPTGTVMVKMIGNKSGLYRCQFTNYHTGVVVGSASIRTITPEIVDCNFFFPKVAGGGGAIWLRNYGNAIVKDTVIGGTTPPALQPDYGLRLHNGDTAFITDTNITAHGMALYVDVPAGQNNYATRISGCLFDSAGPITGISIVASALMIPLGGVYDMLITNTWFGLSSTGSGLSVSPGGAVDGLTLNNCQFVDNAISGVEFIGAGLVKNFQITGGYVSSNAVYGVRVAAGVSDFQINALMAGNIAGRGANARGINIDTGASNNYMVTNCSSRNSTVFNFFDGGSGVNKVLANNLFT